MLTVNITQLIVFHKLQAKNVKNFNIFHPNVNGLESHFENFHQFLSSVPNDFDVINLTETSWKENENFKFNFFNGRI